ncbi:hypothetical protein DVT68_16215 [Dyella solisilvae]|uniref:Uncharacterized protein n=1 Tax=Dyella solisilvae TaxID=1920168 RepID=A0A370K5L9_9GAMM|nr:DUF5694 domain-containing protein [Dyella solisilvae]RDI97310.1 hypothetical protein DVT68_16215 [Dyella solisilvae]
MQRRIIGHLVGLTLAIPVLAQAQVRLDALDASMIGPRSQVMVLGSVHLGQEAKGVEIGPKELAPLLDRLANFAPTVIATENLPGETCDLMRRHPTIYPADEVAHYCPDTSKAQAATGMDVPAAIAESRRLLKSWPREPTSAQRRRLAATFLASGEPGSALVQWLQLPETERRAGDGLNEELVATLNRAQVRQDETNLIGAALAARLGLQRIYSMDDHTADNLDVEDEVAFSKAVQGAWDRAAARAKPVNDREAALAKQGDMLALYRFVNLPANQQLRSEVDFGAALQDSSPEHYGQRYVAGWEGRNMRMATNIRTTFSDHPGARVLVIVGATHKPWLDRWLGELQGVDIVDVQKVLRSSAK